MTPGHVMIREELINKSWSAAIGHLEEKCYEQNDELFRGAYGTYYFELPLG
jgi:hypothetical protein